MKTITPLEGTYFSNANASKYEPYWAMFRLVRFLIILNVEKSDPVKGWYTDLNKASEKAMAFYERRRHGL